jgi:tRNA(fMet)-specific endonuclease VapC
MKRYLLDSNSLSLYVAKREDVFSRAMGVRRSGAKLGTAIPVAAELLAGILYSSTWQTNLPPAERVLRSFRLWPFDTVAAWRYAQLYADLRRNGIKVQPIDLMIASVALTVSDCTVVTCDSDFSRIPGLKIENWEA